MDLIGVGVLGEKNVVQRRGVRKWSDKFGGHEPQGNTNKGIV